MIGGIAASLISAAIARVGTMGLQKAIRLRRIDAAIRSGRTTDPATEKAFAEFQTVLRAHYGALTESVQRFLLELERTGLLTVLAEQAILKVRNPGVKATFVRLHDEIVGQGAGMASLLFDQLASAFEANFQAITKDNAMALLLRASNSITDAHLQGIGSKLDALIGRMPEPQNEDIPATITKIAKGIVTQVKNIRVETNKGQRLVDISKIYIPSKLHIVKSLEDPGAKFRLQRLASSKRRDHGHFHYGPDADPHRVPYAEFRSSFRRVVVLGDPGGGKSTLCQYLCYELAKQSSLQSDTPSGLLESNCQRLPLRVVLRSFEGARQSDPQLSLFDFILRDLGNLITIDQSLLVRALNYLLTYGRAVLAFDGLDEILDTSRRRDFVQLVASFCDQFPLCPVVITSRLVGYSDAPLPEEFELLHLERFDRDEIHSYVSKFLRVVTSQTKDEAEKGAAVFLRQTDASASDLRQNPLMLGLMAFLFAMKGDVPSNRPEIYRECAILMFEKWDQNRNIRASIPHGFDLLHLFSEIASKVYGRPELEDGVTAKWLRAQSEAYFSSYYENKSKAIEAAKLITTFLTGRSWVLSEFGPDIYRFTHRTFLEYFFARHLDEAHETVADLFKVIIPEISNSKWDVIAHLALQLKVYRNQKRIAQAIELLESACAKKTSGKQHHARITFACRALEYLPGAEQDLKRLIYSIVPQVLQTFKNTRELGVIDHCCACTIERREFVEKEISHIISGAITADLGRAARIVDWISSSDGAERWVVSYQYRSALTASLVFQIKTNVREVLWTEAQRSADWGQIYWRWYRTKFEELFSIHNMNLFAPPKDAEFEWFDGLPLIALRSYDLSILPGLTDGNDPEKSAVRAIGKSEIIQWPQESDLNEIRRAQRLPIRIPLDMWHLALKSFQRDFELFRGVLICFVWLAKRNRFFKTVENGKKLMAAKAQSEVVEKTRAELRGIDLLVERATSRGKGSLSFYVEWRQAGTSNPEQRSDLLTLIAQ